MMLAAAVRGSNSIEGYKASIEDALAAVQQDEPFDAGGETWDALTSYRSAMTYVLQLANDPSFRYEQGFIRSLHYMLMQHDLNKNPGNWRLGGISVKDEAKNELVYEAPPREMVEPLMKELIESLNQASDAPELVRAAMAHLNLVMIHPFSDGNGRMARCLHTLVLTREGILEPEFCSIEAHLGRAQQEYYDVLSAVGQGSWHPENDTRAWIRFIMKAHLIQAYRILWFNDQLDKVWAEAIRITEKHKFPERMQQALSDGIIGLKIKNSSYRKFAGVSENLASRDLKALVDAGYFKPEGQKRGRYYTPSPELRALRAKVMERFKIPNPFRAKLPDQPSLPGMELSDSPSPDKQS